jgi:ubiquinone/menaquinone biosynthesis C-methylase UbiE
MEREEWSSVLDALDGFVPYYERVNLAASCFLLPLWRREAARSALPGHEALEIGPATGGFARLLPCRRVYLLEPSMTMASYTRARLPARYKLLRGVAEALPLRSQSVDRVFCIFSFRDFMDRSGALREIHRVLRPGGELHVVDIARPPPGLRRGLVDLWVRSGAPLCADALVPRSVRRTWRENPYGAFLRTYLRFLRLDQVGDLVASQGFQVHSRSLGLKGAFHLRGVRPSTT